MSSLGVTQAEAEEIYEFDKAIDRGERTQYDLDPQKEKEAKAAAKSEELKAFVERMRGVFRTKVSLIGNAQKGRIYIDYYSPEDIYRFEELLFVLENREDY